MKKFLTLFIAIVLVISLTACGDGGAGSSEPVDAVADGQEQQSGGQDKTEGAGSQGQQGNIQPTTGVTDSDPNATVGQQSDLQGNTNKKSNIFVGTWKALEESDPAILTIKDDGTGTITYDNYDAVYEFTYTISKNEDGYTTMEYTSPISSTDTGCLIMKVLGHELMFGSDDTFYCHPDEYEEVMYLGTDFSSQLTADVYTPYVNRANQYIAFVVVHNPTEYPLQVQIAINTYDSEHNLVDTFYPGNKTLAGNSDCLFYGYSGNPFETYEYTINSATVTIDYMPLYDKLSYTSDPNHLVIQNNGQYECESVTADFLWLKDNQIVDHRETSYDVDILPGESKVCEIESTDQEYTERLVFLYSYREFSEEDAEMFIVQ